MCKNLNKKCSQKFLDTAEKSTTDAIKTASKRAIHKAAEVTGYLIGNKIADKIMSVSKKSTKKLPKDKTEADAERGTTKKNTYHQKKDKKLLMN